uniref:Uncharacterized protein n=1 Tax=Arundo donax TaxID=35708 RepID=A0A0A9C2T5_ARUDO
MYGMANVILDTKSIAQPSSIFDKDFQNNGLQ